MVTSPGSDGFGAVFFRKILEYGGMECVFSSIRIFSKWSLAQIMESCNYCTNS
ncbi:hypothetical protein F511_40741 [Dorcoceras hygrometricum]|uniref:Uncharacterized protein n=1 Tax=Dorcoceras hygrometricum TaxID=472368 RepID=A0A2Z7A7K5_9LAMI|nr:hypothetical protein F511_40741 [Dorcoceras hygrometricum]